MKKSLFNRSESFLYQMALAKSVKKNPVFYAVILSNGRVGPIFSDKRTAKSHCKEFADLGVIALNSLDCIK